MRRDKRGLSLEERERLLAQGRAKHERNKRLIDAAAPSGTPGHKTASTKGLPGARLGPAAGNGAELGPAPERILPGDE